MIDGDYTDDKLGRAVRAGQLTRPASGWYASSEASARVTRPLAIGHRLTCVDAAELHGLWIPHRSAEERATLHIYRPAGAVRIPDGFLRHPSRSRSRSWTEMDAVASLPLALEHAMRCLDGETAAILLESAMARGLMSPEEVQALLDSAPSSVRSGIGELSSASDSGSETRVARWLRRRGFKVEQQVFVDEVGYVDAFVGGVLLEIDGRDNHSGPSAFAKDRRRDLRTGRHGLQVLRLSYEQVWHSWADTRKAVLETISSVGTFGRRRAEKLRAG